MQPAKPSTPAWLGVLDDPLRALLLWGIVLSGKPDPALLALIGLSAVELESIVNAYGKSIERLRELKLVCQLLDVEQLRKLSLARLTEMTISATTPQQLYHAARTAARLPEWVLDPELAALEAEVRRAERGARLMESRARHAEAALRLERCGAASSSVAQSTRPVAPPAVADSVGARTSSPQSSSGSSAVTVPSDSGTGAVTAPATSLDAELQNTAHLGISPSQVKSPGTGDVTSPPKRKRRSQSAKPASKQQPSRQPRLSSTGSPR